MALEKPSEPIIRGVDWEMQVTIRDENGDAVDMTTSGYSLILRFRKPGATTNAFTRESSTSTDFTWTSQSTGVGKWIFLSDDADLATDTGSIDYTVDAYFKNTSSNPDEYRFLGSAVWPVRDPKLGSLA